MSTTTTFTSLFDSFLTTEISSLDILKYNPPQLSKYLSSILLRSRQEVYNLIYSPSNVIINKMDDVIEFYYNEYVFTYNGISFTQVLSPIPNAGSSFYITIDNIQTTSFTFDIPTNTLVISGMTNVLHSIDIIAYKDGQFNQTLSLVEQGILLDWMSVEFLKDKIKEQRLYSIAIYGKDFNEKSQANQLGALQKIYNDMRHDVITKCLEYTYRNNPLKYQGFGGRGGVKSS